MNGKLKLRDILIVLATVAMLAVIFSLAGCTLQQRIDAVQGTLTTVQGSLTAERVAQASAQAVLAANPSDKTALKIVRATTGTITAFEAAAAVLTARLAELKAMQAAQ
jgi:hypothetical protein